MFLKVLLLVFNFIYLIFILNLESNPLFASLLPDVVRCFSLYFDIGLLGVKQRPTITMAFSYLMEKRNQLLTVKTASIYFSYLNKLDGINKNFIANISNIQFIPLSGLITFYYSEAQLVFPLDIFFVFITILFYLLTYYIQLGSPECAASFGIFTLNIKCSLKCKRCNRKKVPFFFFVQYRLSIML